MEKSFSFRPLPHTTSIFHIFRVIELTIFHVVDLIHLMNFVSLAIEQ